MNTTWKISRYGCASRRLSHGLTMGVFRDISHPRGSTEPALVVSVFGCCLKRRAASMEEGQATADKVAKELLEDALKTLERRAS